MACIDPAVLKLKITDLIIMCLTSGVVRCFKKLEVWKDPKDIVFWRCRSTFYIRVREKVKGRRGTGTYTYIYMYVDPWGARARRSLYI